MENRGGRYEQVCSTHGEMRNTCKILAENSEGKRLVGRPKRRRQGNIEMIL
jgi:hypothetical protein